MPLGVVFVPHLPGRPEPRPRKTRAPAGVVRDAGLLRNHGAKMLAAYPTSCMASSPTKAVILRACDLCFRTKNGLLLMQKDVPPPPTTALSLGQRSFSLATTLSFLSSRGAPGFPAALLSPATPDVVLFKENHTQPTEAENPDRKSGGSRGICGAPFGCPKFIVSTNHFPFCHPGRRNRPPPAL